MSYTVEEMKSLAAEYAQAGATFLDVHFGNISWRARVDKTRLDMSNGHDCILGQLFENEAVRDGYAFGYLYAMNQVFHLEDYEMVEYGFSRNDLLPSGPYWSILKDAWLVELAK